MRTQVAKCPPPPQPCKLQLLQLPLPIQGPLATSFIWPQDGLLLFFPGPSYSLDSRAQST